MKLKTLLPIALLCLSFSAAADFTTTSRAYEVVLNDFRAPATESGAAFFKTCHTCDAMRVRVTPGTRYFVNDKAVSLRVFRDAVATADRSRTLPVVVLHHLESDTIVSIRLTV